MFGCVHNPNSENSERNAVLAKRIIIFKELQAI